MRENTVAAPVHAPSFLFRTVHTTQESFVSLIRAKSVESRIDLDLQQSVIP
jgi:hypothetical protein